MVVVYVLNKKKQKKETNYIEYIRWDLNKMFVCSIVITLSVKQ